MALGLSHYGMQHRNETARKAPDTERTIRFPHVYANEEACYGRGLVRGYQDPNEMAQPMHNTPALAS